MNIHERLSPLAAVAVAGFTGNMENTMLDKRDIIERSIMLVRYKIMANIDNDDIIHGIIYERKKHIKKGFVVKELDGKKIMNILPKYVEVPADHVPNVQKDLGRLGAIYVKVWVKCMQTKEEWFDIFPKASLREMPPTSMPINVFTGSHPTGCWECGNKEKTLKKCTKCKLAKYCGKECQHAHWKTHKAECNKLGDIIASHVASSPTTS